MIDISLPIHDPVLIFAVVMLIVLIAPLLITRLRVPGLVGLIFAGAIVGPSGLGLLERDATMILLGTVGLLYLMFVAGLALDLDQFNRQRGRSIVFGVASFFLPQAMGIAAGLYLLNFSIPAAVLLGSIVGSHTLLAYPIASRLDITKNTAVVMTMGGTIVTDMLALLLLAVVAGAAEGTLGPVFWIRFVGLVTLYFAMMLWGLPKLGRWFLRSTHGDPNTAFVFLVTALFVSAYLANLAGLAPIIGAFLAGLVLNRLVPELGPLMSRVKFVGETLFIPFFLLSVGMLVDFRVLGGSLDVWAAAGVLIALVVFGKGVATALVSGIYRFSIAEAGTVFGLSVPQAAATLAVTLVGFNLGLFDQAMVNAVIVLIFVTSMVGPWLVERYGRLVALMEAGRAYQPSEAPERTLIPLSNPETAGSLVDVALAIRSGDSEEPVFPLAVVRDGGDVAGEVAAGEKLLSHAVVHVVAADVPVTPMTRVDRDVARGIIRGIAERRISHVVIGWGGAPSPRQRIFGSVLDRLLELSRELILVCKNTRPINTLQRVVFVVPPLAEFEPGFDEAVRTVKRLAARMGAGLAVVVVHRHRQIVEEHLVAARPVVPLNIIEIDSHNRVLGALSELLTEEDLTVLLSSRETQRSWHPALDRLPRLVADRFPKADFLVLYPPIAVHEAEVDGRDQVRLVSTLLPTVRAVPELKAIDPSEALRELLGPAFEEDPKALGELVNLLAAEPDYLRQELAPGIVLLHAHTRLTGAQMLLVGASRDGIRMDPLPRPAQLLVVLLNPIDLPPEKHLRTLAHLARAMHNSIDREDGDAVHQMDRLLEALHQ